ncbi:hypothetical protein [Acinetobacter soli]|uniref:hypothetical protein n=1 Tax=Acinetobacter soli TaxID=487316 RepID=UPI000E6ABFA8|nr:hypothetical protein [Acinetobacter soli]
MNNYKIRVNNEAERLKAQELFFELGYRSGIASNNHFPVLVVAHDCGYGPESTTAISMDHEHHKYYAELTLPQLRDLVVLHRNDVNDATHSCDGMSGAAINLSGSWYGYNYNEKKWQAWDEIEDDEYKISDLKPIQKPQLEQGLISGADALRALADGKEVEYLYGKNNWLSVIEMQVMITAFTGSKFKFRLKPRTVKLEIEVPAPFEPKNGEDFYYLDCTSDNFGGWAKTSWRNIESDSFKNNTAFGAWRTEEEIKIVVEQLRKLKEHSK